MNPQSAKAPTRLRLTGAQYENNSNGYSTFLNEKAELPRLSILDNYKQIMRIMTNSYIKGGEYQNKFKNRMEKDIIHDEEYQKFKEEQLNTIYLDYDKMTKALGDFQQKHTEDIESLETADRYGPIRTQHYTSHYNIDQSEHSTTRHITILTNQNTASHVTLQY